MKHCILDIGANSDERCDTLLEFWVIRLIGGADWQVNIFEVADKTAQFYNIGVVAGRPQIGERLSQFFQILVRPNESYLPQKWLKAFFHTMQAVFQVLPLSNTVGLSG